VRRKNEGRLRKGDRRRGEGGGGSKRTKKMVEK
jgi:hypothetical protein